MVQVLAQQEGGWWEGYLNGRRSWLPKDYCAVLFKPGTPQNLQPASSEGSIGADSSAADSAKSSRNQKPSQHSSLPRRPTQQVVTAGHIGETTAA